MQHRWGGSSWEPTKSMSDAIRAEILAHAANGSLLHAIFHDFGRRRLEDHEPTIVMLADLHNGGEIDVLGLVTRDSIQAFQGQVFWGGQQVYRALIRRIQSSAEALLHVVQIIIEAAGQDMAAGMPAEEFSQWCGADYTLDTAARTLAFDPEHLPDELVDALLEALLAIKGENKGTVEMLDLALMKLVQNGHAERARRYLEHILRREQDRIEFEELDSLSYTLRNAGGRVLEDWVVAWLLDGDYDLCRAMNDALFGAGADEFVFRIDFARFSLADTDYPYLARKAIATFFLKQSIMASLLVSLLRSAPAGATDAIVDLLVDPVLINYAGITDVYLKPISGDSTDPAQAAVQRALEGQEAYLEGLRSIGMVPELHPSERERQLEWQRHSDRMAEAWRAARKKSMLAQIATESLILYGTRAVSWFKDHTDEQRRIETPMGRISHSFEMPRVEIVDPIGLQLMLLHFRGEDRPQ